MTSILQKDPARCWLCGRYGTSADPLDTHHVFFGPYRSNRNRALPDFHGASAKRNLRSERYGLTVKLHHFSCHIYDRGAVHANRAVCRELQAEAQKTAMKEYGWTTEDFIRVFGRNYVEEGENAKIT